jgi:hypothetical protein
MNVTKQSGMNVTKQSGMNVTKRGWMWPVLRSRSRKEPKLLAGGSGFLLRVRIKKKILNHNSKNEQDQQSRK